MVSIVFLSVPSLPLILVISCLGNEGLWRSVAMLLNREPFVSDSGDCQNLWGRERKPVGKWELLDCEGGHFLWCFCHWLESEHLHNKWGNRIPLSWQHKKMQATRKRNAVPVKACCPWCFSHALVPQQHIVEKNVRLWIHFHFPGHIRSMNVFFYCSFNAVPCLLL